MKKIVVSGINLFSGGTLSIFYDCLDSIIENELYNNYEFVLFVHNKKLFEKYIPYFTFIEKPNSRKNWIYRLYYEYFYFKNYSKKDKIHLWISLHDMTPNVKADYLVTYCHNPTPFYKTTIKDLQFDKKIYLFSKFYKYLYKINIRKNDYVIVQQDWIKKEFEKMYNINNVVVFSPEKTVKVDFVKSKKRVSDSVMFFYPSLPRPFKNFEIICEAVDKINKSGCNKKFKVLLTINGKENKYSNYVYKKYSHVPNISFIGLQQRENVFKIYGESDCLLFPSKLETWGLPITEAQLYHLPMIVSDLPYAKETVGEYDSVCFFIPNDSDQLCEVMMKFINSEDIYQPASFKKSKNTIYSWETLINLFEVQ